MNQNRSGWLIGGLFIVFFVALYLISAYNDIFERRRAYLYDPESDDVYLIELAPSLNKYRKWDVFIPFKSLNYTEPDDAKYVGKLHSEIAKFQADMNLLKKEPEAWSAKHDREMEKLISGLDRKPVEFEFWDVKYFSLPIQDASPYMSETLLQMFKSRKIKSTDILVVDAVVALRIVTIQSNSTDNSASLRIIRKALLFKGFAADVLSERGL